MTAVAAVADVSDEQLLHDLTELGGAYVADPSPGTVVNEVAPQWIARRYP